MENEKSNTSSRFTQTGGAWLREVAKIDPDLGNPELWSDARVELIIPEDGALHDLIHKVNDSVIMMGPSKLESALWAAICLGYHLGQKALKSAN